MCVNRFIALIGFVSQKLQKPIPVFGRPQRSDNF